MSEHAVTTRWSHAPLSGTSSGYSRDHEAVFAEGTRLAVSAAPDYHGNADLADPEQLLVSALSSCHMLYFLALCEAQGFRVTDYHDAASGTVEQLDSGGYGVTRITLRPRATFAGDKLPDAKAVKRLHDRAHKGCFIANSIRSQTIIELDD